MEKEIKPEQMVHGKWYVIEVETLWLVKFDRIEMNIIYSTKFISYNDSNSKSENCRAFGLSSYTKSIRPATKDEVLKYFPDEVFEEENTETNLIPFSWEKYQSGEYEVICRDPKHKPTLAGFNPDASDNYKIVAWINGIGYGFKENGTRDADKDYELFLIKKKKKYQFFVALYNDGASSQPYSSYEQCDRNTVALNRVEIRKIEWEV